MPFSDRFGNQTFSSSRLRIVGALTIWLPALFFLGGCRGSSDADSPQNASQGLEIQRKNLFENLHRLIQKSDQVTSPITITLPTGEQIQGRRRLAHPVKPKRSPSFPKRLDPLGSVAQKTPIGLDDPTAFDWAPGSSQVLLQANSSGIWRVDTETGLSSRWITLPKGFQARQILSNPSGPTLVAGAGGVGAISWPDGTSLVRAPNTFQANYVFWEPAGEVVVGISERLIFSAVRDRIYLSSDLWSPSGGSTTSVLVPPLRAQAWLSASPLASRWFAHARKDYQIDPFPSPLTVWDREKPGWVPLSQQKDTKDTSPQFSKAGAIAWIRQSRPGEKTQGSPWYAPPKKNPYEGESVFEQANALDDLSATPLSEVEVDFLRLSEDGKRVAFSRPATSPEEEGFSVWVADSEEVYTRALNRQLRERARLMAERRTQFSHKIQRIAQEIMGEGWKTRDPQSLLEDPDLAEEKIKALDEKMRRALEEDLGVKPDHTLASLTEIDRAFRWIGGDWSGNDDLVIALTAYYGETIRSGSDGVQWSLFEWPLDLSEPSDEFTRSDDFLYTLHAPHLAVQHALRNDLSLASIARRMLAESARPIYLVGRLWDTTITGIQLRALQVYRENGQFKDLPIEKLPPEYDWVTFMILEGNMDIQRPHSLWPLGLELVERHPESAWAFAILGRALLTDEWPDVATLAFQRAAAIDPADPAHAVGAAQSFLEQGKFEQSLEWFQKAHTLDRHGEWADVIQEAFKGLEPLAQQQDPEP